MSTIVRQFVPKSQLFSGFPTASRNLKLLTSRKSLRSNSLPSRAGLGTSIAMKETSRDSNGKKANGTEGAVACLNSPQIVPSVRFSLKLPTWTRSRISDGSPFE